MKPLRFLFFLIPVILLSVLSCGDEPVIPNPEEEITSLTYTLTSVGGGSVAVFSFRDTDGDGGNPPQITIDTLQSGTIYTGEIELLNESTNPVTDVTLEVLDEDDDHQFFYSTAGLNAIISYTDLDSNGFPVGHTTTLTSGGPGTGALKITLRHLPDKTASGVNTGDILNAGGETDIEVTFAPIVIQ